MNILFFISSMRLGGAERAVSKLANYWSSNGHQITIVTLTGDEEDFYTLHKNIRRIRLNLMEPRANLRQKITLQIRRMIGLSRTIKNIKPEVVISFNTDANLLALETKFFHESPILISERTNLNCQVIKKLPAFIRRILYPFAKKIVFVSEGAAQAYDWIKAERKVTILNPVEPPPFLPTVERNYEIVAMGRLVKLKGYDLLIDAFSQIAGKHPDWTLSIYGEGPYRNVLEEKIKSSAYADRIKLAGQTQKVHQVLNAAGIFVLSSYYEGLPNILIEAMSVGTPCVSFDCPYGPSELITHNHDGVLIAPADTDKMAEALQEMIQNPDKRHRLGDNAFSINDRLDIAIIAGQWERLIKSQITL